MHNRKHGLFLNENTNTYEIVGVRKVRRDFVMTDEREPLSFLTRPNLVMLGIHKRDALQTAEGVGTIQTLTSLDLNKLRKTNKKNTPRKWELVLQSFLEWHMRYTQDMAHTKFDFEHESLATQLMVQKKAALVWNDALFANGIVYPVVPVRGEQAFITIDLVQGILHYFEGERAVELKIGVGVFGRMQHVKWPKPTAAGQKLIKSHHPHS